MDENENTALARVGRGESELYPKVVYEAFLTSELEDVATQDAVLVVRQAGVDMDLELVPSTGDDMPPKVVIRSRETDRFETLRDSALVLGTIEVVRRELAKRGTEYLSSEARGEARAVAASALSQICDNPELSQAFNSYFTGIRGDLDERAFIREIFRYGTDFDIEADRQHVTPGVLQGLPYLMGLDISYEDRREWANLTLDQIFSQYPQIDMGRLTDDNFIQTPEGQALKSAYGKLLGAIRAQNYEDYSIRPEIRDWGREIIPLSQFPLIESIVASLVSTINTLSAYGFSKVPFDMAMRSDSAIAQESLVHGLKTFLGAGASYVSEGRSEMQYKELLIQDLARDYVLEPRSDRRQEFKRQLLSILEAYLPGGSMHTGVVTHLKRFDDGRLYPESEGDIRALRDTVRNCLYEGLRSDDPEPFVERCLGVDALSETAISVGMEYSTAVSEQELTLIIFDVLRDSTLKTQPGVLRKLAWGVLSDEAMTDIVGKILEKRRAAQIYANNPEVVEARRVWREAGSGVGAEAKKRKFYETVKPSDDLFQEGNALYNGLVLAHLKSQLDTDSLKERYIGEVIRKVVLYSTQAYPDLLEVAKDARATDAIRSNIFWHIAEKAYPDESTAPFIAPLVVEGLRLFMSSVDKGLVPSSEAAHGLSALEHLVRNKNYIAEAMDLRQLSEVVAYRDKLLGLDFASTPEREDERGFTNAFIVDSCIRKLESMGEAIRRSNPQQRAEIEQ